MGKVSAGMTAVLLIGPLPPPYGGTTVSFEGLARDIEASSMVDVVGVLGTGADDRVQGSVALARALRLGAKVLRAFPRTEVTMLNASNRRAIILGSFLALLSWPFGKRVVVRVFGGGLHKLYSTSGPIFRFMSGLVFSRCEILLQTHELVTFFQGLFPGSRVCWFPTNRNQGEDRHLGPAARQPGAGAITRFLFAGKLCPEKGIHTLVEVFSSLTDRGVTLDLVGEARGADRSWWENLRRDLPPNVQARGGLTPGDLRAALPTYDCLLLPTQWTNEGYPGVVIEAFVAGVPVIVSDVPPITEIVDPSCGVLVKPGDVSWWRSAIIEFIESPALQARLAEGARMRARRFDSAYWNSTLLPLVLSGKWAWEAAADQGHPL